MVYRMLGIYSSQVSCSLSPESKDEIKNVLMIFDMNWTLLSLTDLRRAIAQISSLSTFA